MRVLLLIPALTGAGAERQLAYLASELQRRNHDVLVGFIYRGADTWPNDVPVHCFAERSPWSPRLILDVLQLIRSWKPDVVQTCLPRMDVAGGIAAKLAGVPHVLREPNSPAAYRDLRFLVRRVVGLASNAVAANSTDGCAYWPQRAVTIPNGVPVSRIADAAPLNRPGHPVAVYTGRLAREKNVHVLLRAMERVLRWREMSLYICGDGPERGRLEALAAALGIEARVRFTGYVRNPWSYQRAADVALLLSDFEGHPNVIGECFAAGTPMIVSDIPAHRKLVGKDALLVPPRDPAAAAGAIRDVLDDRDSALERAERAQQRVATWSITNMADLYESLYAAVAMRGVARCG